MTDHDSSRATKPVRAAQLVRFLRWAQWIVIPAVIFAGFETLTRHVKWGSQWPDYFARGRAPDFVLMGSSRVAASVEESVFEQTIAPHHDRPPIALNLGHGYSSLLQNYLYLRNQLQADPDCLRNAVVMLEIADGTLQCEGRDWNGEWYTPGLEYHALGVLQAGDLPRFWRSRMTPEDKLRITFGYVARSSKLVSGRAHLGKRVMQVLQKSATAAFEPLLTSAPAQPQAVADLTTRGGIGIDTRSVEQARRLAVVLAERRNEEQARSSGAAQQEADEVLDDFVQLVQSAGATMAFFETPLHSIQAAPGKTPGGLAARAAFAKRAAEWKTPCVGLNFAAVDDDFPDIWHLRASRAPAFTTGLVEAWVRTCGPSRPLQDASILTASPNETSSEKRR